MTRIKEARTNEKNARKEIRENSFEIARQAQEIASCVIRGDSAGIKHCFDAIDTQRKALNKSVEKHARAQNEINDILNEVMGFVEANPGCTVSEVVANTNDAVNPRNLTSAMAWAHRQDRPEKGSCYGVRYTGRAKVIQHHFAEVTFNNDFFNPETGELIPLVLPGTVKTVKTREKTIELAPLTEYRG